MSIERQGQSRRKKTKMKQEYKDRSKGEMHHGKSLSSQTNRSVTKGRFGLSNPSIL